MQASTGSVVQKKNNQIHNYENFNFCEAFQFEIVLKIIALPLKGLTKLKLA